MSAALAVALATHEFRSWLDRRFAGRGLPPFAIGVGLHAGEVTICRLGSTAVKETTPIGDTVNTAARVEEATRDTGDAVLITEATRRLLRREHGGFEERRAVPLKGKTEQVRLYAPRVVLDADVDPAAGAEPATARRR